MRRDSDPALLLLSRFIFYHSQESLVSSRSWAWHISQGSHLSLETDGSGDFSVAWRRLLYGLTSDEAMPRRQGQMEVESEEKLVWEDGHITNNLSVSLTEINHNC